MKKLICACAFLCALLPQPVFATEKKGLPQIFANIGQPPEGKVRNQLPLEEFTDKYERKNFPPAEKGRKALAYFWFQPAPPYPEGLTFPLVVVLHGATGKSYAGKFLITPAMQMAYPAFILVPAIPEDSVWAQTKPMTLPDGRTVASMGYEALPDVVALIKDLQSQYPIDGRRIYVMGCSEGGIGTFGAVRHYPDVFAAAVPLAGAWMPEDSPQMTKVPLWAFHGAKDSVIPAYLSRDMTTLIHQYGGKAYYTEFPDMNHQCPSPQFYSPQMWEWMFRQIKITAHE